MSHLFLEALGKYILSRRFVKRQFSTKSKVGVSTFESLKAKFFADIKVAMCMEDIINWDQTLIGH